MDKSFVNIAIDQIKLDPTQPRQHFNAASIEGLAESIKTEGLINPIELDADFKILTGERRFKAVQLLNWKTVPVIINSTAMDGYNRLRHQMAENIQQSSGGGQAMSALDTARGYQRMLNYKLDQEAGTALQNIKSMYGDIKEMSEELGVSMDVITDHLRILEYPEYVQKDIESGRARTYYREVEFLPEPQRTQMQAKISRGFYNNRDEIRNTVQLARKFPEQGRLITLQQKQNEKVSAILNSVAHLALKLDRTPLSSIDQPEQPAITSQLQWLQKMILQYLNEGGEN